MLGGGTFVNSRGLVFLGTFGGFLLGQFLLLVFLLPGQLLEHGIQFSILHLELIDKFISFLPALPILLNSRITFPLVFPTSSVHIFGPVHQYLGYLEGTRRIGVVTDLAEEVAAPVGIFAHIVEHLVVEEEVDHLQFCDL